MAKTEVTYEQAQEAADVKKEALKVAKAAARDFRKENKLRPDDVPEDQKLAEKLVKLAGKVEKAQKEYDEAAEAAKALKPKAVRDSKYEYPAEMTAQEKKRFRAKARAEVRKAAKAAEDPKAEKKEKKAKEEAAPAAEKSAKEKRRKEEDED